MFFFQRFSEPGNHRVNLSGRGAALGLTVGNDLARVKRIEEFLFAHGEHLGTFRELFANFFNVDALHLFIREVLRQNIVGACPGNHAAGDVMADAERQSVVVH